MMRRLSPTPAALSSAGALEAFFSHPLTTLILTTSPDALDGLLCNDLYKPRMHNVYARLTPGATLDFMLAIRHTPAPLATIQRTDPALWGAFQQACTRRLTVPPYPDEVLHALKTFTHGAFHFSGEAKERATHQPPAHLQWHSVGNEVLARASGPAEAASHVETTLTQAVQEVTLAAQVRALHGDGTATVSAEELLGSALARLAMGVDYLNKGLSVVDGTGNGADGDDGYVRPKVSLFAGRRSSSRRYLLLQNWYCACFLEGLSGTSSILAVTLLSRLAVILRTSQPHPNPHTMPSVDAAMLRLRLVGTLAHEVPMALEQLLGRAGVLNSLVNSGDCTKFVPGGGQIAALLAHLLMLRTNGGLAEATALPDTFGTRDFVAAALAAKIPSAFWEDVAALHPEEWSGVPESLRGDGARVFDLFRVWRMDSGDYATMAGVVADAWDQRWGSTEYPPGSKHPQRPLFMHSNLSSYEEVVASAHLPARIRPSFLAFGTLADGFLPFQWESQEKESAGENKEHGVPLSSAVKLASVVMKVVQARHAGIEALRPPGAGGYESAGKLGDDESASKLQLDPLVPEYERQSTIQRLKALASSAPMDSEVASRALALAYAAVTSETLLK